MAKLIDVEERDLNYIFGKNNPYKLDVYQRDYRWSDEKDYKIVSQLLNDIEIRFENNMLTNKKENTEELSLILKDVESNFKAYFLNTIMLNKPIEETHTYIVDGQQRLTTILLILIKLYHIGMESETGINISKFIGEKIFEEDMAGIKNFKISNEDRNLIIKKIFEKEDISDNEITNITQANLKANFDVVSKYYDKFFLKENRFDRIKYCYYFYFLISKVLIIEQIIKNKEDVAMIFETANDRGKELEPHEVLKGMLLCVLNLEAKEKCNELWNQALQDFFEVDKNYKNVDEFFRTYFRAKYADNQNQYQNFADKYHRNLLSNDKIIKDLDRSNPSKIECFIKNDFKYFYKTYLEIQKMSKNGSDIYLESNYANEQNQQILLILSALKYNDTEKLDKISLIARKFDQFYTISKLTGYYNNNDLQKLVYDLNKNIRNKSLDEINNIFDGITVPYLKEKGVPINSFNDIFDFKYFERSRIDGRFTNYILARVDLFLATILNEQSFAKQESLFFITHSGNKPANGFHIEHMFANNEKIYEQFKNKEGIIDEKLFNDERNRLGAVILLKGNENIRASNDIYKKKFKSYANSGFLWNKILTDSINKASLNSCIHPIKNKFKSYFPTENGLLSVETIEERQKLLFEIIKEIYCF